jgi:hypothetical protein
MLLAVKLFSQLISTRIMIIGTTTEMPPVDAIRKRASLAENISKLHPLSRKSCKVEHRKKYTMQAKYEGGKGWDLLINKTVHLLRNRTRMKLFYSGFPFTGCILSRSSKSASISFAYSSRLMGGIL